MASLLKNPFHKQDRDMFIELLDIQCKALAEENLEIAYEAELTLIDHRHKMNNCNYEQLAELDIAYFYDNKTTK